MPGSRYFMKELVSFSKVNVSVVVLLQVLGTVEDVFGFFSEYIKGIFTRGNDRVSNAKIEIQMSYFINSCLG